MYKYKYTTSKKNTKYTINIYKKTIRSIIVGYYKNNIIERNKEIII